MSSANLCRVLTGIQGSFTLVTVVNAYLNLRVSSCDLCRENYLHHGS